MTDRNESQLSYMKIFRLLGHSLINCFWFALLREVLFTIGVANPTFLPGVGTGNHHTGNSGLSLITLPTNLHINLKSN